MTVGDTRQVQCAILKNGQPVDATGVQTLAFVLQRRFGSVGTEVARWGLGTGVVIGSPLYLTPAMISAGWASQAVGILTITSAMITWVRSPSSWTGESPWAADTQLQYTWSLVDAFGNVTGDLDSGTFTLEASP